MTPPPSRQARALLLLRHHPLARAFLAAAGETPCHLVGGVVRDRLLGLPAVDFDGVVAGEGREIAERLAAALPARLVPLGGKAFAAYRLVGKGFTLDLWDRAGTSVEADLARRDFTVNAAALDLRDGAFLDPFGAGRDLDARLLRATTPESFTGDPLRVLRLPRLLVQLPGFAAEPATVALARQAAGRLATVASERVREELRLIFAAAAADRALALMVELHLYPGLWLGRPGEPGAAGHAVVELERLESCAVRVRERAEAEAPPLELPAARLALAAANLPAGEPAAALAGLARAGVLLARQAERAAALLAWRELPAGERALRRFLHDAGALWPSAAALLGARRREPAEAAAWEAWLGRVTALVRREGAAILAPPALVSGEDVQRELGVGPGPAVGRALRRVRLAQVDGEVRSREEALALLRSLLT
jgi:poly(A) polymerase